MSFLNALPTDRLLIEASLWSADLGALGAEVERIEPYADLIHIDASDTRFVPEPLFFPAVVAALRPRTTLPFHVHLMARDPGRLADAFADAGADLITVHAEADGAADAIQRIRARGRAAGLALTLDTNIAGVYELIEHVDAVVMVGTPLGTKGTDLDPAAPGRLTAMRRLLDLRGRAVPVLADGGIREHTVPALVAAGASGVVTGSLLLASTDPATTADWLRHHRTAHPNGAAL
ncbi:ribulose-phosphate 3-epimerase [Dactylosporangium darangshiense]|uniref:Ribulose-phosphate 3-epimerase n=1 Tax=Dactylosporangium darangshiense TaxID=579108 RepID=A0ABP8DI11_9ACTN